MPTNIHESSLKSLFLELLQVSLGMRGELSRVPSAHEWEQLLIKAEDQAIVGLLLSGLERLPEEQLPPLEVKLQWIGEFQIEEATYRQHLKVIAKTRDCLENGGVKVAFMKGLVCGSRYPQPERRTCGDIDFVVAEKNIAKTLDLLEGIGTVDRELIHEHHGMAFVDEVTLEPHYKVHNFQNHAVDEAMKAMFAEVFPDRLEIVDLEGEKVPVFPAAFECAVLVGHMVNHVYAEGLGLRQVVARDSLREEISQNLNENMAEHEVVTWTIIHWNPSDSTARPDTVKVERGTDRTRTLDSGSKIQDSRVVVRTVRDTVYVERTDTVEVQEFKVQGSKSLIPPPSTISNGF